MTFSKITDISLTSV